MSHARLASKCLSVAAAAMLFTAASSSAIAKEKQPVEKQSSRAVSSADGDGQRMSLVNPAAELIPHLGPLDDRAEPPELDSQVLSAQFPGEENDLPFGQCSGSNRCTGQAPYWQLMPTGLIYQPLLASAKESRFRSVWNDEKGEGDIWDISLGGQAGLLRFGTIENGIPVGWQLGLEGAGQVRLDSDENNDVMATDYRFGIPITWGDQYSQMKFAYYHLSSHLGDEFLLKNPGFARLNFSRDVLVWGYSLYPVELWRVYFETGYALAADVSDEWEFQFGLEYSPRGSTGMRGEPFAAANAHLREEVDYGGNFVFQTGWAWRRAPTSGMFRVGVEYYNGKSDQFSFFNESEQKVGFAVWYDH